MWFFFARIDKPPENNKYMGTCSIGPEGGLGEWGFGYCVVKKHWGKGYATEMARALMDFACKKGIRDFRCTVAIENAASGRVMQKCGLRIDHESSFKKEERILSIRPTSTRCIFRCPECVNRLRRYAFWKYKGTSMCLPGA